MNDPFDPSAMAANNEQLAASNTELGKRVERLAGLLAAKAEVSDVRKTRLAVFWSYVVNIAHIAVTVAAVTFGLGYVDSQNAIKALAECTARNFHTTSAALAVRTDATSKERAAQRQLFDTLLNPGSSQADKTAATRAYYTGLVQADTQRANNPLPIDKC